jgi:poly(hydroxyalkanoate) granule-associated protein
MATNRKARKKVRATKTEDGMLDSMNQVWLAGIGALSKARKGAPQIMSDLIAEGSRVQAQTRDSANQAIGELVGGIKSSFDTRLNQVRGQAEDAYDNLEAMFQTRVRRALTQLGVPSAEDVESLSQRVGELNASVSKLTRKRIGARGNGRRRAAAHAT